MDEINMAWLAGIGKLTLANTQVSFVVRMMIKTFLRLGYQEGREKTKRMAAGRLREFVVDLAAASNLPCQSRAGLDDLMARWHTLATKRNQLSHGLVGKELDGDHVIADDVGRFEPMPKAGDIEDAVDRMIHLRDDLNKFHTESVRRHCDGVSSVISAMKSGE